MLNVWETLRDRLTRRTARAASAFPVELTAAERALLAHVRSRGLSMVSDARLYATMLACKHVLASGIPGSFVECGVWRGGNALLAAGIFRLHGAARTVHLFDTFAGMTQPGAVDRLAATGELARGEHSRRQRATHNEWCYASLDDVRAAFRDANLLDDNVVFVKGDVLQTLAVAANIPAQIAVLRLDTDWYESTKAELETLYPRLSVGGVLIIDDYGCWAGARRATDEYFSVAASRPFLQYTDDTGRTGVKVTPDS
jgi:hypothetical protein